MMMNQLPSHNVNFSALNLDDDAHDGDLGIFIQKGWVKVAMNSFPGDDESNIIEPLITFACMEITRSKRRKKNTQI